MKHKPPEHIGEVINSYLRSRNWTQRINGYDIFESWEEFIPKKIALNTKPIKIQDHTLFVKVKNHIWANELRIRNGEIINAVNKNIGNNLINGLVIRIDTKYFKKNK
jgi:predicted nucleic acid-binding Zn ribbon protein